MTLLPKFDDNLLEEFMHGFYGYGNYEGDYWFVGMEEGCSSGCEFFSDIEQRLQAWSELKKPELADVFEYQMGKGEKFFGETPKLQRTWAGYIRIQLSAEDKNTQKESVRAYQKDNLGRHNSNNCLLELFPLPSKKSTNWEYSLYSQLKVLESRQKYTDNCAPYRVAHLKQQIYKHKPKAVIFCSKQYIGYWEAIADTEFTESTGVDKKFWIAKNDHTVFAIIYHPTSHGIENGYFHKVGKMIASTR